MSHLTTTVVVAAACLLGDAPRPQAPDGGWATAGGVAMVLAWVLVRYLPARDAQLAEAAARMEAMTERFIQALRDTQQEAARDRKARSDFYRDERQKILEAQPWQEYGKHLERVMVAAERRARMRREDADQSHHGPPAGREEGPGGADTGAG